MALIMAFCTLIVNVLCLPLHLIKALVMYEIYKRVFPICWYRCSIIYNNKMHDKKKELFRSLPDFNRHGKQLTIWRSAVELICTDPNPHFKKYLKSSMEGNDHITFDRFVVASGEDMGAIESESVDVVVCTLVLCSVNNIPKTLQETRRMLRPGGGFFFMEHVVGEPSTWGLRSIGPWTYFFQHVLQPPWYYFGDGCEIVRDTWKPLEATGFSDLKLKHVEAPLMFLIKPHIIGYAVK
ncbi:thiol S-methyltransferase TMT1A-like [Pseudochaenichthys georgianus]|uniref:thiol S-methyltransferase TMT1A-like n=1 Tax=Pseudochaenichthys georgianus TaxID=52239 RepID=UPI00146A6939|nr:methyltransferase-like protein 7A [Pseudochaenichthys georgianus]